MKCETCGTVKCDKCGALQPTFMLPPPFGSLSAKDPAMVCEDCYKAYTRLGFEWLDRPIPADGWLVN